jgi:asparagine synthase (glutamine-hydrolysing)
MVNKNSMTRMWTDADKHGLWSGFTGRDSDDILNDMYAAAESKDPLDQILSVYQKSWLVEDLLMKADKMSMAASLELRVPFLDYRLVEWANSQSSDVKVGRTGRRYETKHVLRRFARKRLPREIVDRPKRGFPVPVHVWLQEESFGRWAREHLIGHSARIKCFFEPQQMEEQLNHAAAGDLRAADKTWLLIVFETWLRAFDVEVEREPALSIPLANC